MLDDFAPCHHVLATYLLRWADFFVFTGEVKGGHITIRPRVVVVTSNYTIDEAFADQPLVTRKALERRFTQVHFVRAPQFE